MVTIRFSGETPLDSKKWLIKEYYLYTCYLIDRFFDHTEHDLWNAEKMIPDNDLAKRLVIDWITYNSPLFFAQMVLENQYRFQNLIYDIRDRYGRPLGNLTNRNHELLALIVKNCKMIQEMIRKTYRDNQSAAA